MMNVEHLANNQVVITKDSKSYFFSYTTLIAILDLNTGCLFENEKKYSKTTSNHLNNFKATRAAYIKDITQVTEEDLQMLA